MEITLIEKSGKRHEMTLPDIEPVSSDWLRSLCDRFFVSSRVSFSVAPHDHRGWEPK
jgi:hypothetical protein